MQRENSAERLAPSGPVSAFIVIGKTGSGKSAFIKSLRGHDLMGDEPTTDNGLDSCTKNPVVYITTLGSRKILLLDTPGFDDSGMENLEVLNRIVATLYTFALRRQDVEIRGVIFLHDISETRFAGSQRKTLEILKALCGAKGMKNCVIGTTMWSAPGTSKYRNEEVREEDFLRIHWKGILQTARIPENDQCVATGIINDILARPPVLLQVQEEILNPPHTTENTTAGRIVMPEGKAESEQLRKEIEEKRIEFEKEMQRKEAEFARGMERMRRQFEDERARWEETNQKLRDRQQNREDDQRRKNQEEMRGLDEEHRRRMREVENERCAEERLRQEEERRRWREFMHGEEQRNRGMEEKRRRQFELERRQWEREIEEVHKREEKRLGDFIKEYVRAMEEPEPVSGLGNIIGTIARGAVKLFPVLGRFL